MLVDRLSGKASAQKIVLNQIDGQATVGHLAAAALNSRQLDRWLVEAANDRPLSYILGHQPFAGLKIQTDRRALIPRPETERLYELIISELKQAPRWLIDLGTGSGCMAIALKKHFSSCQVLASDISPAALNLAKANAKNNQAAISFIQSDLWANIPGRPFDLIVANLPYIPSGEIATLPRRIKDFEPHLALNGQADDGGAIISRMLAGAGKFLTANGQIYLEIHSTHRSKIQSLVKRFLPNRKVIFHFDLAGQTRFAVIGP
ncbi:MAG: peptide chain release factor N(5)-glutamine methyltransferase [Patescibacteria group bacterium]